MVFSDPESVLGEGPKTFIFDLDGVSPILDCDY